MALTINTNLASLAAVKSITETSGNLSKTFERLTSGLRVNTSADDASAYSISTRMTSQIRGMSVAIHNSGDGISVLQVADSALDETTNSLQRMRELMLEVSNPSLTEGDRDVIQNNVADLIIEVERIATDTQYNGTQLLSGGFAAKLFQIGASNGQNLSVTIDAAATENLGIATTEDVGIADATEALTAASANLIAIDAAMNSVSEIRASLGTMQNRFESVVNNLNNMISTTQEARSRLVDADIASETANMTRLSIMRQAGAAVLAQANSQPNVMLQLLRG